MSFWISLWREFFKSRLTEVGRLALTARVNKKEIRNQKAQWIEAPIAYIPPVKMQCDQLRCSCWCDIPTLMNCILEVWSKQTLPHLSCLYHHALSQWQEKKLIQLPILVVYQIIICSVPPIIQSRHSSLHGKFYQMFNPYWLDMFVKLHVGKGVAR